MRSKLLTAGALSASAVGLLAWGVAWATPPSGVTFTPIIGASVLEAFSLRSDTDGLKVKMKTDGTSDLYITHIRIAPGGEGGWHSHPGMSILAVKAGEATFYEDEAPTTPIVFGVGQAMTEGAGEVHNVKNEGAVDLELVVLQIVAPGAPRRIDEDAP